MIMERATGFEPAASTLARWRATNCAKPACGLRIYANIAGSSRRNLQCVGKAWMRGLKKSRDVSPDRRIAEAEEGNRELRARGDGFP